MPWYRFILRVSVDCKFLLEILDPFLGHWFETIACSSRVFREFSLLFFCNLPDLHKVDFFLFNTPVLSSSEVSLCYAFVYP